MLTWAVTRIRAVYQHCVQDSLYRNSLLLMANTVVMGAFGFFFWLINARLFTPEQIGLGSALISAISIVASFSLLGLNIGLIRYLPSSRHPSDMISTVFTITALVTVISATLFLLLVPWLAPELAFVKSDLYYSYFFIASMLFMTLFGIIEAVFVAYRKSEWVVFKGFLFSLGKLAFPFLLVGLGAMGIFGTWTISATIAFLITFFILVKKFGYEWSPHWDFDILREMFRFSFGNYLIGFIAMLPGMLLPIILTHTLGAESTGHYFIAMQLALILWVVPQATTQSLFAEGSANARHLDYYVRKSAIIMAAILIPLVIGIWLFGGWVLGLFGKTYAAEGVTLLKLLAVSTLFSAWNNIAGSILRVRSQLWRLGIAQLLGAVIFLGMCLLWISYGIVGIGYAYIASAAINAVIYLVMIRWPARSEPAGV